MFSNWFTESPTGPNSKRNDIDSRTSATKPRSTIPSVDPLPGPDVSPESPNSAILSLNSPHDAAIDQIDDELRELQVEGSSGEHPPRTRELPENMYDPFDGQSIGLLVPGDFQESEDDLWTHLAQIRNLQSDIARMHAQMERLGENDRLYGLGQTGEDEPAVNVEDEAKVAKAAEFAKLSDRFNGRKEAIDAIMQKLQTLSYSINDFHSSRAPIFRSLTFQDSPDGKENSDKLTSGSIIAQDAGGPSTLSKRILSASQHDALKDSPESMGRSLGDHAGSLG